MSKTNQYTAQQMIDALIATRGMITFAARRLGCSANTIRRYVENYPTVAEVLHELNEQEADAVELALYDEGVNKRNYSVLMFLAKTKHKNRGYTERVENVNLDLTPELTAKLNEVAKALGVKASDLLEAYVQELHVSQSAENT